MANLVCFSIIISMAFLTSPATNNRCLWPEILRCTKNMKTRSCFQSIGGSNLFRPSTAKRNFVSSLGAISKISPSNSKETDWINPPPHEREAAILSYT